MALKSAIGLIGPSKLVKAISLQSRWHNQIRRYSVYNPTYLEPVVLHEEIEKLKGTERLEKMKFQPIKPATNEKTCSVLYDPILIKYINVVMEDGKKELARHLVEKTFEKIKLIQLNKYYDATTDEERSMIECNPYKIFHRALENSKPLVVLTKVKRGGMTYQVPIPVVEHRANFIAMRWLRDAGKEKFRLVRWYEQEAVELIAAAYNTGKVIKKKQDLHRQCEANRAYSHYRWA